MGCATAWLIADLLDDRAVRNEYFGFMETRHKGESPHTAAIFRLLHEAVDRDGGGSLDLSAVAKEQAASAPRNLCIPHFIIGMFLEKHGKPVGARQFLQKAADNPFLAGWPVPIARNMLKKLERNSRGS